MCRLCASATVSSDSDDSESCSALQKAARPSSTSSTAAKYTLCCILTKVSRKRSEAKKCDRLFHRSTKACLKRSQKRALNMKVAPLRQVGVYGTQIMTAFRSGSGIDKLRCFWFASWSNAFSSTFDSLLVKLANFQSTFARPRLLLLKELLRTEPLSFQRVSAFPMFFSSQLSNYNTLDELMRFRITLTLLRLCSLRAALIKVYTAMLHSHERAIWLLLI